MILIVVLFASDTRTAYSDAARTRQIQLQLRAHEIPAFTPVIIGVTVGDEPSRGISA
jgi:hypothetical protein